ncbi:PhnA domain-containing protein [Cytobacillus firmus]|nr:PhnA domain-containing protein [Cytobacillus firmus]MDD9314035.1 PhnA domain-containing protein [Cytobacillus firmus]MED1938673.1 PhnA domain-containing protein [Cytobacillus firmus]NUH86334.1 PhnA domain-containing protein [Cytobacillus firmus]
MITLQRRNSLEKEKLIKDSNGNVLIDGDTVSVIKDN